jgi:hypothetical protein
VTLLTDRGTAIQSSLTRTFEKAFVKPCPKHLARNLNSNGFNSTACHQLYWKATNAPTKAAYDLVIAEMKSTPTGLLVEL